MSTLRVTTVQSVLHWENIGANLNMFSHKLSHLSGKTDLVVLPEMFTTGFSMNAAHLSEHVDGQTMQWLEAQSRKLNAVITGSFIATENGRYFNRLVWMRPDGSFETYDKRHLFTLAGEHEIYTAGQKRLVTEWKGWKICPLICYDLRFPVWSRNNENYDLLIYTANWPERRSYHWKQLLVARAIENQCFVAGVNRLGTDGMNLNYTGDTSIVDFSGKIQYQVSDVEDVFTANLMMKDLQAYRKSLQFLADQDKFEIF
jgi:predicted amidohydrolase